MRNGIARARARGRTPTPSSKENAPEQPEALQQSDSGQPEASHQVEPEPLMVSDAEDIEAKLQADLHHLNPAVRRSAACRLYARKQLPRLEALGVPAPIEQLHHCFCSFSYAPTEPGAEPRCVSCDADPSWPAEVAEIVEATKQYCGE